MKGKIAIAAVQRASQPRPRAKPGARPSAAAASSSSSLAPPPSPPGSLHPRLGGGVAAVPPSPSSGSSRPGPGKQRPPQRRPPPSRRPPAMARAGASSFSSLLPPLSLEGDEDDDDEEEEEEEEPPPSRALVPRSSPVPRPQHPPAPGNGSSSDEEAPLSQQAPQNGHGQPSQNPPGQPEACSPQGALPPTAGRHVLFADALGLPLARWRRYQPWPPPSPESPPEVVAATDALPPPGLYLLPSFVLAPPGQGEEQRLERLRQSKVELEEVLPPEAGEPRVLRGTVRVLNVSYRKAVHVRASRDRWQSHRDYPALYIPDGSPDGGLTDRFAFRLDFGGEEEEEEDEEEGGARLDFVVRYQTDEGVYWANNQGRNYSVVLKGAGPSLGQPKRPGKEGESRRLKSCMRPIKIRSSENELRVEDISQPTCLEEGNTEKELSSEPLNPPAFQPFPPMAQIPELTITTNSPEKKDPSRDRLVDFTDSPQLLALKVPPASHEELQVPCIFPPGAETHPLAPWDMPEFSKRDLTTEGSFMEECLEEQLRRYQELPHRLEEDAIDRELEQLYLSHLSRLRAEELGGRGDWAEEGSENPDSPAPSLIGLRQSVLTDRDLIVNWTGPERALNSSLAEEITLHYAKQRGDDFRNSEEEGLAPEYATLAQPGQGRESPPVLLEGCFLNHLEEGSVQQSPVKDPDDTFVSLRAVLPNVLRPTAQDAAVMPLVVPARTPTPFPNHPPELLSSPVGAHGQSKSQGFLIGQGSLWLSEGNNVLKARETHPNSHSELERILTRSLRFLGLFVFLPVVFSSYMPLVAVTLYLLLDRFS
ncbi:protein phosphatase 1 regulatory subunit 3F [Heteronotia binoei]|uniref:protein phosphatase 1 regulatory subunit 3F n=1 Tax=Heteronotia binoei TaxID=13085 RepID=UPI00292DF942|nr:protein phosphatase 1 regulatory subunit 3F [Heteronotia binoei]